MIPLRKSTTSQEIPLGPFVDSTDGDTEETALTISNTDIKLWKNGATSLANKNSGGATHMAGGVYYCTLDDTDTNTTGPLVIWVHESGSLYVRVECYVFDGAIFDALFTSGADGFDAAGRVNVGQWLGNAVTFGTGGPDVNINAISDDTTAAANLELFTEISNITSLIVSAGGAVDSMVQGFLDNTIAETTADNIAGNFETFFDNGDSTTTNTVDDVGGGSVPTAAAIADAVWDEAQTDHTTGGSFGVIATEIASILVDTGTTLDGKLDTIDSNVDAILVDTNELQTDDVPGLIAALNDPTAAAIADAVWDEAQTDHTTAGSFGVIATEIASILVDTADMQPKLGTITDLGGGATIADNLADMAGATFATASDSLEAIRDRGDAAWTTGAGGSDRLLMVDTTIATLSTQTSFTLTAGSTDDDAYNGLTIVIEDASTATQKAIGIVDDYTGSTKTITLLEDPGVFTMAATDKVYILAEKSLKPTTSANYHVDVTNGGAVGIDWGNVENPTTAVDLSATDIQLCDTVTTLTGHTAQTGDTYALANGSAGFVAIDTVVDGIQTDLDNGTDGLGALKALIDALNDLSAAAVNAEVDTALADIHLDHLLAVDYDPASKPGTATALLNELVESDSGVSRFTANALEQGPDTDHTGTGSGLTAIPWNAAWDAEVQSEVDDALTAYNAVATTDLPSNFADLSITATTGRVDVAAVAGTSQTAGDLAALITTVDTVVDSILVDTAEIGAAGAGLTAVPWNAAWDAEVQSEVQDAIEANHLDHLLAVDYDPASKPGTATALLNELVESDGGVSRFTANALEEAPSGGGGGGLTALGSGTAQGGTSTTIQLAAASTFADDELIGNMVKITSGTGAGQSRQITDHVSSTDTSSVDRAWTTTPDATSVYEIVEGHLPETVADAVLTRNVSNVESAAGEHTLCTSILAGLESAISGTTWTIYETDGTTVHVTKTVGKTSGDAPIRTIS